MHQLPLDALSRQVSVSPLVLSDRLLTLAEDADRAGFTGTAEQLLNLAWAVLDEPPPRHH